MPAVNGVSVRCPECGFLHYDAATLYCGLCREKERALSVEITSHTRWHGQSPVLHTKLTPGEMPPPSYEDALEATSGGMPETPQMALEATNDTQAMPSVAPTPVTPPESPREASAAPRVKCTLCRHPDHEAINAALRAGASLADLARQYGGCSSTWTRHRRNCLTLPPTSPLAGRDTVAFQASRPRRICAYAGCEVDITTKPNKSRFCSVRHGALARTQTAREAGRVVVPTTPKPTPARRRAGRPVLHFDTLVERHLANKQAELVAAEAKVWRLREQISALVQYQVAGTGEAHGTQD